VTLHDIEFPGITPTPLGSYLAAIGILRAAGAAFPETRGWWSEAGTFWLRSRKSTDELVEWFTEEREPDVFVRPWNPDPNEDRRALQDLPESWNRARRALEFSVRQVEKSEELKGLRRKLQARKADLKRRGLDAKQDPEVRQLGADVEKASQILGTQALRSLAPESVLACFDCSRVTTTDGSTVYAPLLGSGGNDGKRDFMLVYLRQLRATQADRARSAAWLRSALGLEVTSSAPLPKESGNSWFPDSVKIHNSGQEGFFTEQMASPWAYLLACEGVRSLAGGSSRRLGINANPSGTFPFVFMPPAYSTKEEAKKTDAEFWAPLWNKPAKWSEVASLLRAGRAAVSGNAARKPHQVAEALLARGVDRGISAFQRFSLDHTTSANTFEVIPLGRFRTRDSDGVAAQCLAELEEWHDRLPQDSTKVVVGIRRRVEDAILHVCEAPCEAVRWERLLVTCADAELRIARNKSFRAQSRGLPPLSVEWLRFASAGAVDGEFLFAAAVGSITNLRQNIFGAKRAWAGIDLLQDLTEILRRRLLDDSGTEGVPLAGRYACPPKVLAAFLNGLLDERRIQTLIPAFALLAWNPNWRTGLPGLPPSGTESLRGACVPMPLTLMKCLFQPVNLRLGNRRAFGDVKFAPRCPEALATLLAGDAARAVQHASRRLRACGLRPVPIAAAGVSLPTCRRWAAALLVPWPQMCLEQGLRDVLEVQSDRNGES
jgi:CRISPR-associated protein Csx17